MRALKWTVSLLLLAVVGAFLHYVLPKREVVRITDAYNRFVEPGELRGVRALREGTTTDQAGRIGADVLFIVGTDRDGDRWEFRNEDTGFGFPWYFKFDTATLDNQARDSISTADAPRWMILRYYGWRIPFLSMFPNAVSMKPAPSQDVRLIPWFNIILLTALGAVVWAVWARVRRWRRRRLDPAVEAWQTEVERRQAGFWRWFGRR